MLRAELSRSQRQRVAGIATEVYDAWQAGSWTPGKEVRGKMRTGVTPFDETFPEVEAVARGLFKQVVVMRSGWVVKFAHDPSDQARPSGEQNIHDEWALYDAIRNHAPELFDYLPTTYRLPSGVYVQEACVTWDDGRLTRDEKDAVDDMTDILSHREFHDLHPGNVGVRKFLRTPVAIDFAGVHTDRIMREIAGCTVKRYRRDHL